MIEAPTDNALDVVELISLHGDVTEKVARLRGKLDLLVTLRAGISDTPDISEEWTRDAIARYERMLAKIAAQLGWT